MPLNLSNIYTFVEDVPIASLYITSICIIIRVHIYTVLHSHRCTHVEDLSISLDPACTGRREYTCRSHVNIYTNTTLGGLSRPFTSHHAPHCVAAGHCGACPIHMSLLHAVIRSLPALRPSLCSASVQVRRTRHPYHAVLTNLVRLTRTAALYVFTSSCVLVCLVYVISSIEFYVDGRFPPHAIEDACELLMALTMLAVTEVGTTGLIPALPLFNGAQVRFVVIA